MEKITNGMRYLYCLIRHLNDDFTLHRSDHKLYELDCASCGYGTEKPKCTLKYFKTYNQNFS